MPQPPRLVVVTGPPGAGKTTVAAAIRGRLGLALLEKDVLKETLGAELGVAGRTESQRLGIAVFELLAVLVRELLGAGCSLIVEGNFRAGTTTFDAMPPARVVQVFVSADPAVLRERLETRTTHAHPVHYDREAAAEIEQRAGAGEWRPLPLEGELVRIDTTVWPATLDTLLDSAGL